MRVAIYARVSTESQEARGTIGSQLEVLRTRVATEGHELVAEYRDDGWSGARLDRPGLDALRDAAQAGRLDAVWCLSPDRLARVYAYQVIVIDELARFGVTVRFHDAPPIADDPQAQLLTQVQGVIAEYERAKIAERYRRGKLWRSRAGEVIAWKCSYGYRRIARSGRRAAHLEVYEPEAAVVRRIFRDYVESGQSMRQICWQLNQDRVPSPSGKAVWGVSVVGRLIRNEAYVGRAYYNRTTSVSDRRPAKAKRQIKRPRNEWISLPVPAIIDEALFEAAQRVSYDNSRWSPRRTDPDHWLLRGLVKCGHCGISVSCHKMRGRNGTFHRYYYCRNHDPLRAGGEHRQCPERNVRADELDVFVFEQLRITLLRPDVLIAGEAAVSTHREVRDDDVLANQLAKLDRKIDSVAAERRRIADLYQAGFIDQQELLRRGTELELRLNHLTAQRNALFGQREQLAQRDRLRDRVEGFAHKVRVTIDQLDFVQRQQLLRLVVDEVRVQGWRVEMRLRIPLDNDPEPPSGTVSSKDRLRPLHRDQRRELPQTFRRDPPEAANRQRQQARHQAAGGHHPTNSLTRRATSSLSSSVSHVIFSMRSDRTSSLSLTGHLSCRATSSIRARNSAINLCASSSRTISARISASFCACDSLLRSAALLTPTLNRAARYRVNPVLADHWPQAAIASRGRVEQLQRRQMV
ncbi:MAG: recombinase family protein [Alphaproteobacteria bacterium]|nr:recombinase family protein [Alphaproteobacteria bacterium]